MTKNSTVIKVRGWQQKFKLTNFNCKPQRSELWLILADKVSYYKYYIFFPCWRKAPKQLEEREQDNPNCPTLYVCDTELSPRGVWVTWIYVSCLRQESGGTRQRGVRELLNLPHVLISECNCKHFVCLLPKVTPPGRRGVVNGKPVSVAVVHLQRPLSQ